MSAGKHTHIISGLTLGAFGLAFGLGCGPASQGSSNQAFYDAPQRIPMGVPYSGPATDGEASEAVASPEECGRSRGIDGEGNCVRMQSRPHEFGGMVQIPTGALLRGDIATRFDATRKPERPHVANSGQPLFQDQLPAYWIDGYEVSRKAYAKCVEQGGCTAALCLDGSDGRPTDRQLGDLDLSAFPQTCVTHEQAETYCSWRGARLPTEAEWEYAARGPQAWMYPWGHEFRDELGLALGPVGFDPLDVSYFGLKGFGGNANEWVADVFEPDDNLMHYLSGPFRLDNGPLKTAWAEWTRQLCGGSDCELGQRHVVKGGRCGGRAGAWRLAPGRSLAEIPSENFEGDRAIAQHERTGFRCAADLGPDDQTLTVPEGPAPLPVFRESGGLRLFFGVAEAVNREEAARFCSMVVAPDEPRPPDGQPANRWRLPTLAEVQANHQWFAGPGPFWLADGPAEQTFVDTETSEWSMIEAPDDQPLLARCVREL